MKSKRGGRILIAFAVIVLSAAAQQPTCPNGQIPKLDSARRPIQCLPGSSQKVVCGADHACFFTGINYVCCPSNEPTQENQPTCNEPYLTVLAQDGLPLRCSPRTRHCPGKTQFCSDVGLAYICCERAIGRDPPAEVEPVPRWEESLECPADTLGVLNDKGNRVVCNSKKRCPGKHQFCFGGLKRSICCERYEMAARLQPPTTVQPKKPKSTKRKSVFLKQVSLQAASTKAPVTEDSVIRSDTFVSNTAMRRQSVVVAAPRRGTQNARSVELLSSNADVKTQREFIETVQDSASVQRPNKVMKLNASPRNRHHGFESAEPATRRVKATTTTTERTTTAESTTPEPEWLLKEETTELPIRRTTTTIESTTTERELFPTAEPFRRARVHAVKTVDTQQKPIEVGDFDSVPQNIEFANAGFAQAQPVPTSRSQEMPTEDKRQIAETFIMQQIRDGWPYNDRFYRPGNE